MSKGLDIERHEQIGRTENDPVRRCTGNSWQGVGVEFCQKQSLGTDWSLERLILTF